MSSRNLAALGVAVAAGVASGVYTFGPMLKEQQKAQEHWRNPGEPRTDAAPHAKSVEVQAQTDGSPGSSKEK